MTDDSLFREVDEEVRQDELKKLWQRHGTKLTTLIVAVVAAVAAWKGFQYYQLKQAEASSVAYFDAAKKAADGKQDDALAAFAAINHPGFKQLARLREAGLAAAKGETDKAVKLYEALASETGTDPAIADAAQIRAGYLLVDTATPDQLLTRLGKYDTETSIWRNSAREIFGLAAWRTNDYVMASRYMTAIFADPQATQPMRQRAQAILQLIAPNLPKP